MPSSPPLLHTTKFLAGLVGLALLAGCGTYSVMQLNRARNVYHPVPGVPFYSVSGYCRQETTLQQDVRRLTLQVDSFIINPTTATIDSARQVFRSERLVEGRIVRSDAFLVLRDLLQDQQSRDSLMSVFYNLKEYRPDAWQTDSLLLVSNQTTVATFVDYSKPYYMNTNRPIVGSANNSLELSPSGTLTKASATVDDKTVTAFLSPIPIKDVFTSIWPTGGGQQLGLVPKYKHTLVVESVPVLHTLSAARGEHMPCNPHPPIVPDRSNTGYSYARSTVTAPATPGTPSNAITVSGQITMPPAPKP